MNLLFRIFIVLLVLAPAAHADTQVIALKKGWNLISTNLTDSRATSVIFNSSIASEISTYTAATGWKTYNLTTSSGDLTAMPSHQGVWVKALANGNVTIDGTTATVDYSGISTGWNMLAPGGQTTPQGLESAIESAGSNATRMGVYDPINGWSHYNIESGKGLLTGLAEGQGVWAKVYIPPPAQVAKTGQTTSYVADDDGALQSGVAWPTIRFTDNGDGTIMDELTGLVWMQNANCWGSMDWSAALSKISALNGPSGCTGYTGNHSDWRLPNVNELAGLVDAERYNPALPSGHPFTGVQTGNYWSSTSNANYTGSAWLVNLSNGSVSYANKTSNYYVWPVRGGQ